VIIQIQTICLILLEAKLYRVILRQQEFHLQAVALRVAQIGKLKKQKKFLFNTILQAEIIVWCSKESSVQTDGLWDFEDGFYPTEILGDWWIDNSDKYQGEYSLRAPLNTTGICGFDIDVGLADSASFWHKCSYSGINYPKIRIGTNEDFMASNCSGSWNEYKFPTRGQQPLHIETDCVSGFERRIDHLKAW